MARGTRALTLGERGKLIRLFSDTDKKGVKKWVVQWGRPRQQKSFPYTKTGKADAEAFVKGFTDELLAKRSAVVHTMRSLWLAYLTAEFDALRPRTQQLYRDAWRKWEQFATEDAVVNDLSIHQIHEFRRALDAQRLATATVRGIIRAVRVVFNWAESQEIITRNRWHLFTYKVSKEKRTAQRAEYRADEFVKIWGALHPEQVGQWRPWVAIGLLGIYGNRANEILNLRWSWIDGDTVTIPPALVKTGEASRLELFPLTRAILAVADQWRAAEGYAGDYILFPGKHHGARHASRKPHYSIQSLTDALHLAEARAGVPTVRLRALHGFRRGLLGDVADQTGDITLALQVIGDRDLDMVKHYRVKRDDRKNDAVQNRVRLILPNANEAAAEREDVARQAPQAADT